MANLNHLKVIGSCKWLYILKKKEFNLMYIFDKECLLVIKTKTNIKFTIYI